MIASRWARLGAANVCLLLTLTSLSWTRQDSPAASPQITATRQQPTATDADESNASAPVPFRSIDLAPLNFRRLSSPRSRDGSFHVSLAFFSEERLLVTFEGTEMVRRQHGCPRTHDDRIVHAVVVDVQTGQILRRADWYLHDRQQYLWPLTSGKMLLRRGDSLLEVDENLSETTAAQYPELIWADVTPDGERIIAGVAMNSATPSDKPRSPAYEARILDSSSLKLLSTLPMDRPISQRLTSAGYADVILKNGWTWLVRFGAQGQPRRAITRVRSSCIPDLQVSSEKTLVVGRCTTAQDKYIISSFSTDGQFLWRHHWGQQRNTPLVGRMSSGSRFALSTVERVQQDVSQHTEMNDEKQELRRQKIELFNVASGTSVLSLETEPAVTVGGNVALSPEGGVLAVLRDNHVELYRLPELDKDEATRLAAVQAGTPGLLAPEAGSDSSDDPELASDDDPSTKQLLAAAGKLGTTPPREKSHAQPAMPETSAAKEAASEDSKIVIRSRAEAVIVDVLVTDSKGHPIPGLKAEDFTVTEDGTPQTVNFFKEHSVIDTQLIPPPEYKRPPNIFSNVSNTSQPDSSTLILFDMLNTAPQDQVHARDSLMKYIKTKPRNESFALCVLDGPLHLVRGFTADENELLLAMQEQRVKPSASLISQLDTASIRFIRSATQKLDTPMDVTRSFAIAMAGLERELQDEQLSQDDMRTYLTVGAFEELARYMAGVPGRKKILWLSAAFPLGQFASGQGLDAGPFHQQRNFVPLISKTMDLLASAHVSVYPVDIRGVMLNSIADVAEERPFTEDLPSSPLTNPSGMGQQAQAGGSGFDASAAAASREMANDHAKPQDAFLQRAIEDSSRRNSEHNAMDLVAEETGGKAFYGSNDIASALRTVIEQGSDYYTLSYTPSNRRYDGRFRKIRVRVAGKGYHLAHRSGYFAEDPSRPTAKSEAVLRSLSIAGMMHGAPESRQIPFQARVVGVGEPKIVNRADIGIQGEMKNPSIRVQHYSIDYAIPATSLRFEPGSEGDFHGNFRLLANSYDAEGRGLMQSASSAVADLKPDRYQQVISAGFRLHQEIDVPAEASFLRLGVTDLATSYIGTLELPLPVPVPKDSPMARNRGSLPPVEPE